MTVDDVMKRRLNLGCGRDVRPDCVNVDSVASIGPDLIWDLDKAPYPLPSGHFERIFALDVVEHLADLRSFLEEAHRLLAPGGVIEITTPHFSCANSFTDPTHRRHLGYFSFDYFTDGGQHNHYSTARFRIKSRVIAFPAGRWIKFFALWANRHPARYEQRWAWVRPAWFLRFELEAIK